MGVPDGAGRERTAILPAGYQELGVPIGDMGRSQPLQFMVAQVWNDQLRDEPAVFLFRLASEPMEAIPGAQIISDHDLARLDQGTLMGGSDQPGKLALGILSLAANCEVACLTLTGNGIRKIELDAPAISAAPRDVAFHLRLSLPNPRSWKSCQRRNGRSGLNGSAHPFGSGAFSFPFESSWGALSIKAIRRNASIRPRLAGRL